MLPAKWRSYAKRCLSSGVESEEAPTTLQMPANLPTSVMRLLFCRSLCPVALNLVHRFFTNDEYRNVCTLRVVRLPARNFPCPFVRFRLLLRSPPGTSEESARPWKRNEANAFNRVVHVVRSRYMKFHRSKADDDIGVPASDCSMRLSWT